MSEVLLEGCTPEPLGSYLKALGVLRLVAEQADRDARGWWAEGAFRLRSRLTREDLERFFLEEYSPTPIIAPWGGGSGFYVKWNEKKQEVKGREACEILDEFGRPTRGRFQHLVGAIRSLREHLLARSVSFDPRRASRKALAENLLIRDGEKVRALTREQKDSLLRDLRRSQPDNVIRWLDTAWVLQRDNQTTLPLMGSGGNDGNLDFSVTFLRHLRSVLALEEGAAPPATSAALLAAALFGEQSALERGSPGQYDPGSSSGPGSGPGFEGIDLVNPWSYILLLEGALLFAGSVSRRFANEEGRVSLPFTVTATPAGGGTLASPDAGAARAEVWVPLWERPAGLAELARLLAEGRAQVGRRQATSSIDFVRAIAGLGVDRGLSEFRRFGFLQRAGRMYIAVPLGRYRTRGSADRGARLLDSIDEWLKRVHRAEAAAVAARVRLLDEMVLRYCRAPEPSRFREVAAAVGAVERAVASCPKAREAAIPLPPLPAGWIEACDEVSEVRLAAALASYRPSLRPLLEPVGHQERVRWADGGGAASWGRGGLGWNLARVLERLLLGDLAKVRNTGWPATDGSVAPPARHAAPAGPEPAERLPRAAYAAPLEEIAYFLEGALDEQMIQDLLWTFSAVSEPAPGLQATLAPWSLPREFALLKLMFLDRALPLGTGGGQTWESIRLEPDLRLLRLVLADPCRAVEEAVRRLRTVGLFPLGETRRGVAPRLSFVNRLDRERLAGALLVPVSNPQVLARLVLRPISASIQQGANR